MNKRLKAVAVMDTPDGWEEANTVSEEERTASRRMRAASTGRYRPSDQLAARAAIEGMSYRRSLAAKELQNGH